MGNRAVITTGKSPYDIGVYLHWNGGRDSVEAFLKYCELKEYRAPDKDCYGWARLCQVIGNFLGGTSSIGIDTRHNLDCDNGDNGVYIIKGWEIVGREFFHSFQQEQRNCNLLDMLLDINDAQPEKERMSADFIVDVIAKA